jgi:hypothetical protein
MEHDYIRHRLSEYIDGSITAQEKTELEEHLRTCAACSDALRELQKTIEHIKTIEEIEPPAWMTQKIMATVRAAAEEKKSLFQRLFYPLKVKLPIQAIAVLFLAVTGFYIYQNIQLAERASEAPSQEFAAKKLVPPTDTAQDKIAKAERPALRSKQVPQTPAYKSLDMKLEYEKPAPPAPLDKAEAPTSAPAKAAEEPAFAKKELAAGKVASVPQAGAPRMMKEEATSVGTSQPAETKRKSNILAKQSDSGQTGATIREQVDIDDMKLLKGHFVEHDLPKNMQAKGLKFSAYIVPEDLSGLAWLDNEVQNTLRPCTRKYKIEVELADRMQNYFYCMDNSTFLLIAKYERINGKWTSIR